METALGLIRDFLAAAIGLAILFGASFSDDQIAGILLVVTTGVALATYAYNRLVKPPEHHH